MPTITENELLSILNSNNYAKFQQITTHPSAPTYAISALAKDFPDQREQLFDFITANQAEFERVTAHPTGTAHAINTLAEIFPQKREQLFERITANQAEFERVTADPISTAYAINTLAGIFPQKREQLFERITANQQECERATRHITDAKYAIEQLSEDFPKQFQEIGFTPGHPPARAELWQAIEARRIRLHEKSKSTIIRNIRLICQGQCSNKRNALTNLPGDGSVAAIIAGFSGIYGAHKADIPGAKPADLEAYQHFGRPKVTPEVAEMVARARARAVMTEAAAKGAQRTVAQPPKAGPK
jgi:hypothetical protein